MRDTKFKRGQIWWMEGYEAHNGIRKRPALIISNEVINSNTTNNSIIVIPITSNIERSDIKTNILFDRHTRTKNIIKCDSIVSIYKDQLVGYESTLDDEAMEKVEEALKFALGLAEEPQAIEVSKEEITPVIVEEAVTDEEEIIEEEAITTNIDTDYAKLMSFEVKKRGRNIVWTAESEMVFMKLYSEYGIDTVVEKFKTTYKSATTMAYQLRKKYPDFKAKKRGKKTEVEKQCV